MSATTTLTQQILKYHNQTKHSFTRYSRGPPTLDWSNQPNPFRLYPPCPILTLPHPHQNELSSPPCHTPFTQSIAPSPHPLTLSTISHLLYHSLALSAWKSTAYSTWSLRVNPSSGNLHPTESYVISPPVKSLSNHAFVAHYAPKYHALELRARIPSEFFELFPENTILVGLTSIFWREAWKYGERAFRYCNHDVGHAIGAVTMAAAGLGFDVKVLDGLGFEELKVLMGLGIFPEIAIPDRPVKGKMPEIEFEHPDCVLCIFPNDSGSKLEVDYGKIREVLLKDYEGIEWLGKPNVLSKEHVCWDIIYKTAKSTEKPVTNMGKEELTKPWKSSGTISEDAYKGFSLSEVVRKRRSAVDMDRKTSIERDTFYQILLHCMASGAGEKQIKQLALPFRALPWDCEVHAVIFVHRIVGLPKGLYFLVRNEDHFEDIRAEMRSEFKWTKPEGCPDDLPLYELVKGDCQEPSKQLSCFQDIASDGCFSLGMVARLEPTLHDVGQWMYPRLFWETGVLGQVLYLEAHAIGISATGIGCFFDDPVHEILGLKGMKYQSLYHFTVGGPVEDKRIMSLPAYPGPDDDFNLRNSNRNVVTSF